MRQILLAEDLGAKLDELLSFVTVVFHADRFREKLVTSHTDQGPHDIERHVVAACRERVHPGLSVRVVAVYERAVEIEDYAFEQYYFGNALLQRLLNRFSLVEVALNYRRCLLDEILELCVLRLPSRLGRQIENRFVRIYLGIDIGLIEILAFCR